MEIRFVKKEELRKVDEKIASALAGYVKCSKLVSCSKCGCLLYKKDAIKGKSEIETVPVYTIFGESSEVEEYIVTRYYCRRCKTK